MVTKNNDTISTDIYYKATDTHQYLDFRSCHPSHTKRNIPFCLARRICTIVNDVEKRNQRLCELSEFLKRQNYPGTLVQQSIERAKAIPLAELRSTTRRENDTDIIPFVSTHNPCNPNMYEIIRTSLPLLRQNEELKTLFPVESILKSKRQPKNLKRILTRARFGKVKPFSVKKCEDKRCGICKNLHVGEKLELTNGSTITPNRDLSCDSENLIYCVLCKGCNKCYIGQTGNSLRQRFTVHRQQIRDPNTRMIDLSEHLEICANSTNYSIFPFYKVAKPIKSLRLAKEAHFIGLFKPGLNSTV